MCKAMKNNLDNDVKRQSTVDGNIGLLNNYIGDTRQKRKINYLKSGIIISLIIVTTTMWDIFEIGCMFMWIVLIRAYLMRNTAI